MRKYLYFIVFVILTFFANACKNSLDKELYKAKTHEIAQKANIPLIQLHYSSPQGSVTFETAQSDFMTASEECGTVFQAASLSKVVFAYIVLRMVDKGEMDLDKPLVNYTDIERFVSKEEAGVITARMVLSHKTGLPNWSAGPSSAEWPTSPIKFLFRPDSTFAYSGEGFAFLQRAVEKIKGKSLQEIVMEEVFIPLKMTKSCYGWLDIYDQCAVEGFNKEGVGRGKVAYPRENAAYTLMTNCSDYSKFLDAIIAGKGLKKETRREFFTSEVKAKRYSNRERPSDSFIDWGLGIGIEHNPELGDIYFHWGDNGVYKALFVIVPSQKSYLLYFTNSAYGHSMIDELMPVYFNNTKPLAISGWIND